MNNSNRGDAATAKPYSQLFTVRIWAEISEQGIVTWRGKVQQVPNGAWRYFQDWVALTTFLQGQMVEVAAEAQQHSGQHSAESRGG